MAPCQACPHGKPSCSTWDTEHLQQCTHLSAPADVLHPKGFDQHSTLLKHFSEGNFEAFEKLMKVHVTGTRDNYLRTLKLGTR